MSDEGATLTWLDKILIIVCSLALALVFGTVLCVVALLLVIYG
jgi:hypothetical protein